MHEWKKYEGQILTTFRDKWPDADLRADIKIRGLHSKVNRQIDIYISGSIVGRVITGAIECKHFNRKVDVPVVDAFIGFLEDIGANFGIIITNMGFTTAAENRAKAKGIHIDIVAFEDIDAYTIEWNSCDACLSIGNGHREIDWRHAPFKANVSSKSFSIEQGQCSYCNTTHIKCTKCGGVFCIHEKYGEPIECYCGTTWIAQREYIGSGMDEEVFYVRKGKRDIPLEYSA